MESAATVEEEKSNLKERMEAYREQMDAVKQDLYFLVLVYVFITIWYVVCDLSSNNFYRTSIQQIYFFTETLEFVGGIVKNYISILLTWMFENFRFAKEFIGMH